MAEKGALQKLSWDGRAIDGHELPAAPGRPRVQRSGHQLLAGSRLTSDQNRGTGIRDLVHQPKYAVHLRARRDDRVLIGPQPAILTTELAVLGGCLHHCVESVSVDGLLDVVEGPVPHRLEGPFAAAKRGQYDDDRRRISLPQRGEERHPIHLRHAQICQNEVDVLRVPRQPLRAIGGARHAVARLRQVERQDLAHRVVVIYE